MSENKEDIDLLSQKELEDGEIEEGELDEPECMSTVDIEPEIINTDVLDDSDVNIGDKNVLKNKKHKHHKKCHKRHMNLEEKVDSKWKRSKKSVDECDGAEDSPKIIESINIIDSDSCENENPMVGSFQNQSKPEIECDKVKSSVKWGSYESEDEVNSFNNFNNIEKSISFNEKSNKHPDRGLSPACELNETDREVPVVSEVREICKWNDYDSDNEASTSASSKIDFKRNTFDENQNSKAKVFKSWDSSSKINSDRGWENEDNRGWENNTHITNSPAKSPEYENSEIKASSPISKAVWDSYDSPRDDDKIVKNVNANSSPLQTNNNFGKWGSYNSPEKETGNFQKWGASHSPKGADDDNAKWGTRDSPNKNDGDFKKWGSRDSPKRDDNYQRWGSRDGSRDGSRRNNYRRWGPRDGSRRNNSWRRGSRDGSYRNNDNQKWGSSNNDSPQRYNDDKSWGANNGSPQRNNEKRWGNSPQRNNDDNKRWNSSNSSSPQRGNDGGKKWGSSNNGSPQRHNDDKKWSSSNNESPLMGKENVIQNFDLPEKAKWGSYDSDDDQAKPSNEPNETVELKNDSQSNSWNFNNNPDKSKWDAQNSPKGNDNVETTGFSKWGAFDSDEEGKPIVKENSHVTTDMGKSNKPSWKSFDSEDESKGSFNENKNKGNYNNSSWNKNDKSDFKNDRNKRWSNRNDGEKRNVCKYFSMGSCRHGDRCTFLHESPTKPVSQEVKKKELCKFYEHQQCYKRNNCIYMHEEFPCKLFHAGSKMCPSGDSCKYSHAPLNQETRTLLEKYLDEKVDERTDKNASEWSSIIKKSAEDDLDDDGPVGFEQPDNFFPDPVRYRFPGGQDMMRFPVRPWNSMMRFNDMPMQFPHQMEFMPRQRFLCQYPMNAGRIFPRGFRGMVPPNIHEGFSNGLPYTIPPLMQNNPKLPTDMKDSFNISDPYIDNLAQLVVGKDLPTSPKRLVDMLDPNMQCEDIDDFSLEIETNNSKKNLLSPVVIKSPEIPPGAYVPRTSMNATQPNVRLGPGPAYGSEQAMMYGGYPAHPGDSAMMDYINMSAIHYFHNHTETMGYDVPWKLLLLEVPIKIPYPLMVIETQDLVHKYTDPRLKGHPSVMNSNNSTDESAMHQNSYDFNTMPSFGSSSLPSPNFITASSESSETLTPLNDFLPKSDDPESPMFPIGEEIFNFKQKLMETERISDRSYLQDPRFKRKKVIVNTSMDPSDME